MNIGLLASVGEMIDSFFPGIIAAWRAAGHRVSSAAGTPVADGSCTVIGGLTRRPGPGILRARAQLRRWVSDHGLDVVVTNSATASAIVRSSGIETPIVYFCHGLHWNSGRTAPERVWQKVETGLLRRTAGVITLNADDHSWFTERFPRQRVLRLPSGVGLDLDSYPAVPVDRADRRLRLVWIGEFSPRKRPDLALSVAVGLRDLGVEFELRMLGEGSLLEATRERIRRQGLGELVAAPGSGHAASALASAHALIHTSTWEGLPRVMLESLAVGRTAFAFDVKGVRDIPGVVLGPDGDAAGLADRIAGAWASGELLDPTAFDRDELDQGRSADQIRLFVEETIIGRHRALARGGSTPGRSRSARERTARNAAK